MANEKASVNITFGKNGSVEINFSLGLVTDKKTGITTKLRASEFQLIEEACFYARFFCKIHRVERRRLKKAKHYPGAKFQAQIIKAEKDELEAHYKMRHSALAQQEGEEALVCEFRKWCPEEGVIRYAPRASEIKAESPNTLDINMSGKVIEPVRKMTTIDEFELNEYYGICRFCEYCLGEAPKSRVECAFYRKDQKPRKKRCKGYEPHSSHNVKNSED